MGFGVGEPWVVPISEILLSERCMRGIGLLGWGHVMNEADGPHPHK